MTSITLDSIEIVADHVRTYHFLPERRIRYEAGQFIELVIPNHNPKFGELKHWFTLSSSPSEPHLSITTRFQSAHGSTYKQILGSLQPGDEALASDPMGDFVLPISKEVPLIFIVGGIGITPVRSMIKWLADTNQTRNIRLLYAATSEADIAFRDLFDKHATTTYILSKPSAGWQGNVGRITPENILAQAKPTRDSLLYISGPEIMVEQLTKGLIDKGISPLRIVSDYFPGYSPV
jgi:ferredoxin-NADP reductase